VCNWIGLVSIACLLAAPAPEEQVRYLRPTATGFTQECEFTLEHKDGFRIRSVTGRGDTRMTVSSTYDKDGRLTSADASLKKGEQTTKATVNVAGDRATVQREGQPAQEFAVPPHVIVTSAPDWTDTFLLCRRFDQKKAGKQEFAGLWIHPQQPAQRPTFTIERIGSDTIMHDGKKLELGRFTITLRPTSRYVAWADAEGRMIKLTPLPFRPDARNWLVLEGYEKSALELKPAE
jgi:hypothetical protein